MKMVSNQFSVSQFLSVSPIFAYTVQYMTKRHCAVLHNIFIVFVSQNPYLKANQKLQMCDKI